MAERESEALTEMRLRPIRAESRSVVIATVGITVLPYALAGVTLVAMFLGRDTAAVISAIGAAIAAGPQLIQAIRGRAASPDRQPKPDSQS